MDRYLVMWRLQYTLLLDAYAFHLPTTVDKEPKKKEDLVAFFGGRLDTIMLRRGRGIIQIEKLFSFEYL